MTKIEERAKEWAENHYDEDWKGAAFISYVKGATDQQAIDDEEYRKDMRYISTKREELIDKACVVIHNMMVDGYDFIIRDSDYVLEIFRNRMNE